MLLCALMLPFFATAQEEAMSQEESFVPQRYTWVMTIQPKDAEHAAEFEPVFRQMEELIAQFNEEPTRADSEGLYQNFLSFVSGLQTSVSNGLNVIASVATTTEEAIEAQVESLTEQINESNEQAQAQEEAAQNEETSAPSFLEKIDAAVDSAVATVATTASTVGQAVSHYLSTICIGFSCSMTEIDELNAWNKAKLMLEELAQNINDKNIRTEDALKALDQIRMTISGLRESTLLLYAGRETQVHSNNSQTSNN